MVTQKSSVHPKINFGLGKNGGYMPCCLGGRLINVRRQSEGMRKFFCDFTSLIQCILKLSLGV